MKVIIWMLTFFLGAVINSLIGEVSGIRAGAFLLFLVEYHIGKALCNSWDRRHMKNQPEAEMCTELESRAGTEEGRQPQEGQNTVNSCPHCGKPLLPDSLFCSACGQKVESSARQKDKAEDKEQKIPGQT